MSRIKVFSPARYIEAALKHAEYEQDENSIAVSTAPGASGLLAQGDTYEEARANLQEVIEGNVLLALHTWDGRDLPSQVWTFKSRMSRLTHLREPAFSSQRPKDEGSIPTRASRGKQKTFQYAFMS